ncbi:MAG: thioredoxin domain-containing protein [Cytophagaceae bacterium]|nr:thioredoxin domain-containing protein [Cytophagaceae bacterium]
MHNMSHPSNALIHESSPYLQQHAYNPVDWKPWNDETLQLAINEDKPIIISIGYSSCHWCHVMEKQSFEDTEVAESMNKHFICIKVDREERPDLDQIYMDAVQAMNIRGGWPLNVFLTPDKKPFYGGTYFPKDHWIHILGQVSNAFKEHREDLEKSAAGFATTLQASEIQKYGLHSPKPIDDSIIEEAYMRLDRQFDTVWGGLDKVPKFPMPSIWQFLLGYHYATGKQSALDQTVLTLNRIAMGGLYDQAGGGFARYSTDGEWLAPHFEKMLYDNGQLLSLYSHGYQLTQDRNFKEVADQTVEWLSREMTADEGGFYSALDADSEGEEGKFYVWTLEELIPVFSPEADIWLEYFSIQEEGNWEGHNILFRQRFDEGFIKDCKLEPAYFYKRRTEIYAKLLSLRSQRPRPFLDDKQIASWNGLMLKGLIDWYKASGSGKALQLALNNAHFIEKHLLDSAHLSHSYKKGGKKSPGFLDDYAYVIDGFIALHEATLEAHWLHLAKDLMNTVLSEFYDEAEGYFFYSSAASTDLIARKKEIFDNVIPSSNSGIAKCLFQLGHFYLYEEWIQASTSMCQRISHLIKTESSYLTNWATLALWIKEPFLEVVVVGPEAPEFVAQLNRSYLPFKIVTGSKSVDNQIPLLVDRTTQDEKTYIYICNNAACLRPVASVNEALTLIQSHYEKK